MANNQQFILYAYLHSFNSAANLKKMLNDCYAFLMNNLRKRLRCRLR